MNLFQRLLGRKSPKTSGVSEAAPVETPPAPTSPKPSSGRATLILPSPKKYATPTTRLRFGLKSDIGGRNNNEDSALATLFSTELGGDPSSIGLFAVADGMGGHADGERASSLTARLLARHVLDDVVIPQLDERKPSSDEKLIQEVLLEALAAANTSVRERFPDSGTTVTCVVIRGDLAYIVHVGDSRAYLYVDYNLEQVTRGHRLVDRMIELGQLTAEEAKIHPQSNVLYKAVGASEQLEVDAETRKLPPSARLLLCSDGLWDTIGDAGIKAILKESADPQEACDQLIASANASGSKDNVTAVLVQMPD